MCLLSNIYISVTCFLRSTVAGSKEFWEKTSWKLLNLIVHRKENFSTLRAAALQLLEELIKMLLQLKISDII